MSAAESEELAVRKRKLRLFVLYFIVFRMFIIYQYCIYLHLIPSLSYCDL